jgi:hypothetical protein
VRPEAVVEVGRPQVELVRRRAAGRPDVPTLLYAPTWEGWSSDQDYSSVSTHGALLLRAVLEHPDPVRIVYRPHPYIGRRNSRTKAAHQELVEMIRAANATAGIAGDHVMGAEHGQEWPPSGSAAEDEVTAVARGEERLRALPAHAHVVVEPGSLPLISCFNTADGLVTDVSSVLSDFLQSDKPLGVCAGPGQQAEDFVAAFPSADAAEVLPPEEAAVRGFLDVLTGRRSDPAAERRAAVRRAVLGPGEPSATARFADAVAALSDRAHRSKADITESRPSPT